MKKILMILMSVLTLTLVACKHDEPTPQETTLAVMVSDVTATTATVTVTPSDTTTAYYFDVLTKHEFDSLGTAGLHDFYQEYFEYAIQYYAYYGYDVTVADFLSTGEDSYDFESLTPNTEYVAVAFVYDSASVSSVTTKEFTTPEAEASTMTVNFTVGDTAIYIKPSNEEESYFVSYAATDSIKAYGYTTTSYATALYSYLTNYYGSYFSSYCEYTGSVYLPLTSLTEDVTLFACGSTNGVQTTDWFTYEYSTTATAEMPRKAPKCVIRTSNKNNKASFNTKIQLFNKY